LLEDLAYTISQNKNKETIVGLESEDDEENLSGENLSEDSDEGDSEGEELRESYTSSSDEETKK